MKKLLAFAASVSFLASLLLLPQTSLAGGGIFASGGGSYRVGDSFTVTVAASGATFNAVEGSISVSGPVSVSSFSYNTSSSIYWQSTPGNGKQFDGVITGSTASSLSIATITLKATGTGSGAVSVSGVRLINDGNVVATSGGSASYSVQRALNLPGSVNVSSSSHPDQSQAYEATTIQLSWDRGGGVDGFGYVLDQSSGTAAPQAVTSNDTSATYANKAVGTYYFHIRAHDGDGWGPTTTFKISIKEPGPKVKDGLTAPTLTAISAAPDFRIDRDKGTVSGVIFTGTGTAGYTMNFSFSPSLSIPTTASVDATGHFTHVVEAPIPAGFYDVKLQSQQDKTLSPASGDYHFDVSLQKGGLISMVFTPTPSASASAKATVKPAGYNFNRDAGLTIGEAVGLSLLTGLATFLITRRKLLKKTS